MRRHVDWLLGDPLATPPDYAAAAAEGLLLVPPSFHANSHIAVYGAPPGTSCHGLRSIVCAAARPVQSASARPA